MILALAGNSDRLLLWASRIPQGLILGHRSSGSPPLAAHLCWLLLKTSHEKYLSSVAFRMNWQHLPTWLASRKENV